MKATFEDAGFPPHYHHLPTKFSAFGQLLDERSASVGAVGAGAAPEGAG